MRMRNLVGAISVAGFVGIVVQAAAANQCPASELGACARLHLAMMRPPTAVPPLLTPVVAVVPMRADTRQG